jgi:arabinan endo-1,5-alpha-L-arabinosidase
MADPLSAMRNIHDPAIIREGEWFYVFSSGPGVPVHRSRDLVNFEPAGRVFRLDVPDWASKEVPGSTMVWAPDIALVDGRYVLTYSVGTFGRNRSVIGMASTPTLDAAARGYDWRHDGKVVESFVGDDHNAIDSNLFVDGDRRVWLSWGSYWTGIKIVELDRATLKPRPGAAIESIARREADGGIEAPFIVERNGWYYLFLSFDKCCREHQPLMRGGGMRVMETAGRVIGPGHCAVIEDGGRWFLVHHYYDGAAQGVPTLGVRELLWDHLGWPRAGAAVGER